jgi:hypothetical protein
VRTVIVYLKNASKPEVSRFLSDRYVREEAPQWILEVDGDACLYISFYEHGPIEHLPEEWTKLHGDLRYIPSVCVAADVSGRHPGDDQVHSFVVEILQKFEGHAKDDYSDHVWTLEEILSGQSAYGHPFFDYRGWNQEAII